MAPFQSRLNCPVGLDPPPSDSQVNKCVQRINFNSPPHLPHTSIIVGRLHDLSRLSYLDSGCCPTYEQSKSKHFDLFQMANSQQPATFQWSRFPNEVQQKIFREALLDLIASSHPRIVELIPYYVAASKTQKNDQVAFEASERIGKGLDSPIDLTESDNEEDVKDDIKHGIIDLTKDDAGRAADKHNQEVMESPKNANKEVIETGSPTPEPSQPDRPLWVVHPHSLPCREFLSLCANSREVVKNYYNQHFHPTTVIETTPWSANSKIFFNFEHDVLYINRQFTFGMIGHMQLFWEITADDEGETQNGETPSSQRWKEVFDTIFTEAQLNDNESLVGCLKEGGKMNDAVGAYVYPLDNVTRSGGLYNYDEIKRKIDTMILRGNTLPVRLMKNMTSKLIQFHGEGNVLRAIEEEDEDPLIIEEIWVFPGYATCWRAKGYQYCFEENELALKQALKYLINEKEWSANYLDMVVDGFQGGRYRNCCMQMFFDDSY